MHKIEELKAIFGVGGFYDENPKKNRYRIDQVGDEAYAQQPLAVVFPETTQQVADLMKWAYANDVPVTPRGGGSGLSGGAIPAAGGVVCSFEKMNKILEIDTNNLMAVLQPGVITNALDEALKPLGLFFAGYPMSEDMCFIGGNVAENAGGGRAVKYGTTSTYVVGAEVVTPQGEILKLGGKRLKDVTGYNLLQLFVGSEGTLGLFTEITLRLVPRPAVRGVAFYGFSTTAQATSVIGPLKRIRTLSSLEFIDGPTARETNQELPASQRTDLPSGKNAYLLVEADGETLDEVDEGLKAMAKVALEAGGVEVATGTDTVSYERAWKLRKAVPWWVKRHAQAYHSLEDVVVPPSKIPEIVDFVDTLRTEYTIPIAVFGHAGDGNFHITPMKSAELDPDKWKPLVSKLLVQLYQRVIELGGTISGEHGIGRKRTKYLSTALSAEVIQSMAGIKKAMDPKNLLNPGVMF